MRTVIRCRCRWCLSLRPLRSALGRTGDHRAARTAARQPVRALADAVGVAPPRIPLADAPGEMVRGAAGWPAGLDDLPDVPSRLRVAGCLPALAGAVAIVGTRYADADALAFARGLAHDLAAAGATVVSGGARGVDRAAHDGALDAGRPTVAVLATGFDRAYPPGHASLFATIATTGALITEAPDGIPPLPPLFLQRNRLIAALAEAVVVVQAPARSGALSSAAWARRLGRRLFAVPGAPWDPRAEGCLWLLRRGAQVCTSASDVLSVRPAPAAETPTSGAPKRNNSPDIAMLDEDGQIVLAALGSRGRHPDELASSLGIPAARVQGILLGLELSGFVQEAGGAFRRALG